MSQRRSERQPAADDAPARRWLGTVDAIVGVELFFSIVLATAGQVLFKLAVRNEPLGPALLLQPKMIGGILAYGSSAILWIIVLSRLPLNVAYPFVSLNFVFVAIAGWIFLREPMNWHHVAGLALIILGLIIVRR